MKKLALIFAMMFVAGCSRAPSTPPQQSLNVSAAASLKDVMAAITKEYSGAQIKFNFASSGTLQRQIENGAPVDVVILAADSNMDELQKAKLIDASTRGVLAQNRLVLVVPKNSRLPIRSFADLQKTEVEKVAIGAPQSVPAGKYAQQVLEKIGIWKQVEKKAIRGKDVREVLTQVEQGNVDAGIVYLTDAALSSKVKVISIAPVKLHERIRYPFAVVQDSKNQNAAKNFATFLQSRQARRILKKYHFVLG